MNPLETIRDYYDRQRSQAPTAPFCLSTISADGFPNSRFVDLKGVTDDGLFFGTDERSVKAREFGKNNLVSACLWWEPLAVQIRVQGTVEKAGATLADKVFATRNPTAQAIASVSIQSQVLVDEDGLKRQVKALVSSSQGVIGRPPSWWVYQIVPSTVEILSFSDDRIHLRTRFERSNGAWISKRLSP